MRAVREVFVPSASSGESMSHSIVQNGRGKNIEVAQYKEHRHNSERGDVKGTEHDVLGSWCR